MCFCEAVCTDHSSPRRSATQAFALFLWTCCVLLHSSHVCLFLKLLAVFQCFFIALSLFMLSVWRFTSSQYVWLVVCWWTETWSFYTLNKLHMNDSSCHSYFDASDFCTFTELFLVTEYFCQITYVTGHRTINLHLRLLNNKKTPEVDKMFNILEGKRKSWEMFKV